MIAELTDSRLRVSNTAVLYSAFLIIFSIVARDAYNYLVQVLGRELLSWVLWSTFVFSAFIAGRVALKLGWRSLVALLILACIALAYAASFELLEERTHLIKYGALGWLVSRDTRDSSTQASAIVAMLAVLMVGSWDETVQSFTPGRVGDIRDVFFDCIGGVFGILLWKIAGQKGRPATN